MTNARLYRAIATQAIIDLTISDAAFAEQFLQIIATLPPIDRAAGADAAFAILRIKVRESIDALDDDAVLGYLAIRAGLIDPSSEIGFTPAGVFFKIGQFAYSDDPEQPHFLALFNFLLDAAYRAGFDDGGRLRRAMATEVDPLDDDDLADLLRGAIAAVGEQDFMQIAMQQCGKLQS